MSEDQAVEEFRELMQDPAARQAFVELKREKARDGARVRFEHVLKAVFSTPWAILPNYMELVCDVLVTRMSGARITAEELERVEAARRPARPQAPQGVAVLPIHGVIVPKASLFSDLSGATSVEGFRAMFRDALAASDVGSIVLDIDSPGGSGDQIPEMAAEIRGSRGRKPIVAVANGLAASAAYWLGSQADEFVATKSGLVGSIGVITAHEDVSKAVEAQGIKVTTITGGRRKAELSPFEPLGDEARAHVQSIVDEFYGMFVSDVARGRQVSVADVRSEKFGEGTVFTASEGVKRGLIDRVASLEDVVGERFAAQRPMRAATAAANATDRLVAAVLQGRAEPDVTPVPMARVETPEPPEPEVPVEEPDPEPDPEPEPSELDAVKDALDLLKL